MRVSMHPGQYTVLNSPDDEVLVSTIRELEYHDAVFQLMGLDRDHRIVIHGGGAYDDKAFSLRVMERRIRELPPGLRHRVVLENDERVFTAADIYNVCRVTGTPGVFDVFHHSILPSFPGVNTRAVILLFQTTWGDWRQKIHYSDQEPSKNPGAHSGTIDVEAFGEFMRTVEDLDLDIMLEVKDK